MDKSYQLTSALNRFFALTFVLTIFSAQPGVTGQQVGSYFARNQEANAVSYPIEAQGGSPSAAEVEPTIEPDCQCLGCQPQTRVKLTGDWLGYRSCLEENGFTVESSLTQFYQGVASGGAEQRFRYGSKMDLYFLLNTEKLGWWEGGSFQIHAADWQFGQSANADATFLAAVNSPMLYPKAEPSFAVTQLLLEQELGEGYVAMIGRYNLLDLWLGFYPDYGRGVDGFMNVSSFVPFNIVTVGLPPISNLAGIVKAGDKGLESGLLAYETTNNPTQIGLNFENGVTILGFGRKYTEFGGLAGNHTLAGWYATGDFTSLDTHEWVQLPSGLPQPTQQSGTWSFSYIAEQRIWQDACDDKRYVKTLGYVDWSDGDVNLFDFTAGGSIEAFGFLPNRSADRMGLAYFYNSLGELENLLGNISPAGDVHGGEVYYNMRITPSFHLTCDLQAIRPTFRNRDTAIVLGLRGKLDF